MCIECGTGQLYVLVNTLLCGLTDSANEFVSKKRWRNKMCFFSFLCREKRVCAATEAWSRSQCARWMCKSLKPLFHLYSSPQLCLMLLPSSSLFLLANFFPLDKCACKRMWLSGLFCLRGIVVLILCECCVCVSFYPLISGSCSLSVSDLNSKADRCQTATGDVILSMLLYCWDMYSILIASIANDKHSNIIVNEV